MTLTPRTDITIYHNAHCSKSRETLALLHAQGIAPTVVDYLAQPPTLAQWHDLVQRLGGPVRQALRTQDALYTELDLADSRWSDAQLLAQLTQHPCLLNRPIVVTPHGARVCRPPERVLELLETTTRHHHTR